jgi:hypothetical protein
MQAEKKMADIDLADETFDRILKYYGESIDPTMMPEEHRTVLAVYHSYGVLGNGGFQYLFEGDLTGDPHFQITRESYATIGATTASAAFDKAYAVFPNSIPPKDMDQRLSIWGSNYRIPGSLMDDSSPDSMYFAAMDDVMAKLTQYIQSRPEAFSDLR